MADSVLAFDARWRGTVSMGEALPATQGSPVHALLARSERLATYWDLNDPTIRERLVARAGQCASPRLIWLLLTLLDRGSSAAWEGPFRLQALKVLAEAEDAMLRFAAYRWLARLHTIDLRCEMTSKRVLLEGVARERGLAKRRVEQLLRSC